MIIRVSLHSDFSNTHKKGKNHFKIIFSFFVLCTTPKAQYDIVEFLCDSAIH